MSPTLLLALRSAPAAARPWRRAAWHGRRVRCFATPVAGTEARHALAEIVLEMAQVQQARLVQSGLERAPFALVTSNTLACAATLRAAMQLRCHVVLLPKQELAPLAVEHAKVRGIVHLDGPSGSLSVDWTQAPLPSSAELALPPWTAALRGTGGAGDADEGGACVMLTSGSGQAGPKLVAHSWSAVELQARTTVERTLAAAAAGAGRRVRFVAASSIGHAYNSNGMLSALAAGAELGLAASAEQLLESLQAAPHPDCQSTVAFASPLMLQRLLELPAVASGELARQLAASSHKVHVFSAGCPLPQEVSAGLLAKLGTRVLHNYGSTETGNIGLEDLADAGAPPPSQGSSFSVCRPWGRVELRAPRGGRLPPPGAEGEICAHVPWVSAGYLLDGQLTPHEEAPFVRTGDAGRWDGEGRLVIMQRLRAPIVVRSGRVRVALQPYEVEAATLEALPVGSAAAALQGRDEKLFLAVSIPEEHLKKLRRRPSDGEPAVLGLPVPVDRVLLLPQLPTSPAGKVLYSQLAEMLAQQEQA